MVAAAHHGATALWLACERGSLEVARVLVAQHANVDAAAGAQRVPVLHAALHGGDEAIVRCLLAAGVDLHAADASGRTAVHVACERNQAQLLDVLLDAGADASLPLAGSARTPLMIACEHDSVSCVRCVCVDVMGG